MLNLSVTEEIPPAASGTNPQDLITNIKEASLSREERIYQVIGEKALVRERSFVDIASVIQEGVVVKVSASFYNGSVKLSPEELGIRQSNEDTRRLVERKRITLGRKCLLPPEIGNKLTKSVGQARRALYDHSFEIESGWWMPTSRWASFKGQFLKAKEDFNSSLQVIADQYPAIQDWIRKTYRPVAANAWEAVGEQWSRESGLTFEVGAPAPEEFLQSFLEKLVATLPPSDEIISNASLEYGISILTAPDSELAKSYATGNPDLNAELVSQLSAEKRNLVDRFFRSCEAGLAKSLLEVVTGVREGLEKRALAGKSKLHGKSFNTILTAVANLRDLNVINSPAVEEMLSELEVYLQDYDAKSLPTLADVGSALEKTSARIDAILQETLQETSTFDGLD